MRLERGSYKGRVVEHTLAFHAAKAKAQAKVKAEAARGPTLKKVRVLNQQEVRGGVPIGWPGPPVHVQVLLHPR